MAANNAGNPEMIAAIGRRAGRVVAAVMAFTALAACHGPALSPEQTVAREMQTMREMIPVVVTDPGRAAQLQEKAGQLQAEINDFDAALLTLGQELQKLNTDPDASRAQFTALFSRFEAERKASRQRLVQTHLAMLALTTPAEWAALAPYERNALVVMIDLKGES